jgi:hypothetical protein
LRKLYNDELNDLNMIYKYYTGDRSIIMRWAWYVARMRGRRGVHRIWWENLREGDHPDIHWRIILR